MRDQNIELAVRRLAIFGSETPAVLAAEALQAGRQTNYSETDISLLQELTLALQAYQPVPTPLGVAPEGRYAIKRFPWEWLLGLLAGFGIGLLIAWVISPIRYVDTSPNTLRADFKDQFRVAIAASYASDHNLGRAKARLALLGDSDAVQALTAQAQRMLGAGESFDTIQEVAGLATDLQTGVSSILPTASASPIPIQLISTQTVAIPLTATGTQGAITETPTAQAADTPVIFDTPTPRPTKTAIPTAGAPFQLLSQDQVCNPNLTDGLMQIIVLDNHRHQMPGMEIIVTWNGGEDHLFTGFKPEIGNGYADYIMQPGVIYSVRVAQPGLPVPNLSAPACPDSNGQTYTGGIKLTFQQP